MEISCHCDIKVDYPLNIWDCLGVDYITGKTMDDEDEI